MKKVVTGVFVVIMLILSGFIFPRFFIKGDNVADFEDDRKKFAEYALYQTKNANRTRPLQALALIYRVLEVNKLSSDTKKCGFVVKNESKEELRGDYEAVVQTYTFFGMPLATSIVDCEGIT